MSVAAVVRGILFRLAAWRLTQAQADEICAAAQARVTR